MPLPSSGQITLNQIHVEAGGSSGSQAALNDADIRSMIGKSSGATNSFSDYHGITNSAPTALYIGRALTTGNGFPNGYVPLSSGNKVVVVALALAGPANTYVNLGSTSMTQACKIDTPSSNPNIWQGGPTAAIYWVETTASGSVYISGNGGSGRSVLHAWEITGYNSATPHSTATAQNTDASSYSKIISLSTKYNGCTIGTGVCEDTSPAGSVTVSNSDSLQQIDLESATNHYSWRDQGASEGTTNYDCDQNNPASNLNPNSTIQQLAAAHWK